MYLPHSLHFKFSFLNTVLNPPSPLRPFRFYSRNAFGKRLEIIIPFHLTSLYFSSNHRIFPLPHLTSCFSFQSTPSEFSCYFNFKFIISSLPNTWVSQLPDRLSVLSILCSSVWNTDVKRVCCNLFSSSLSVWLSLQNCGSCHLTNQQTSQYSTTI